MTAETAAESTADVRRGIAAADVRRAGLPVEREIRLPESAGHENGDSKPENGDPHPPEGLAGLLTPIDSYAPTADADATHRPLVVDSPVETRLKRGLFLLVALAVCGLHIAFTHTYWAPAHWGNNQSAYLAAGKLLATTGTTGFEPSSPFQFVGWMWNMADEASTHPAGGWHYPKYPAGLPLLNAVAYTLGGWFGGPDGAVNWMLKVPPLSVTAAMLAVFFTTRLLAGSFAGVLAMILFGLLTVVVVLTNNPYSHAADLAFVTWGMFALLKWWQHGGWWRGAIAGLLVGYATTIRYTEGLLVLPLIAASLTTIRWPRPRWWAAAWSLTAAVLVGAVAWYFVRYAGVKDAAVSRTAVAVVLAVAAAPLLAMLVVMARDGRLAPFVRAAVPLIAWTIPPAVLVTFNLLTVGSPTGYDATNESTGFTLAELQRKWRWGIDQFYNTGLYFVLPLSLFGMLMAFRWNWKLGLWLTLWFVPSTLLYLSYYWGMNLPVWGFLRFFASVLPAGVIAAVWAMQRASAASTEGSDDGTFSPRRIAAAVVATIIVGGAAGAVAAWALDSSTDRYPAFVALYGIAGGLLAAAVAAGGRGVAAPVAMGALVAFPTCINVDASIAPLERDFTLATNLANVGTQCRLVVPAGSVVFGHSQYLHNYLDFAGRYTLIGGDYLMGNRPVPGGIRGGPDGENPNPIQPSRKKLVERVYAEMDREARIASAVKMAEDAFANGQRVFIVQESAGAGALRDALAKSSGGRLAFDAVARWTDPVRLTPAAVGALMTTRDQMGRREPWRWLILEVKPAAAPATPPATTRSSVIAERPR